MPKAESVPRLLRVGVRAGLLPFSREQMREFFAGADTMNMLLDNTLKLEGNMSVLFKFAHMSAVLTHKHKLAATPSLHDNWPRDWRAMTALPCGEPCSERPAGEVTHLEDPYLAGTWMHSKMHCCDWKNLDAAWLFEF